MSRHFRIMLAILLAVTALLVVLPSSYVAAGGMVANQSFEQGDGTVPDGWATDGNATRVDTGPIYQGSWTAQIAGDGGALGQWVYVGNTSVGLPVTYNFWGAIYVSGNVTGKIALDFWGGATNISQVSPPTVLSSDDTDGAYVEVSGQVSAPVAATWARLRLLGTGWENGGEVRFDEIGFFPVTGYCFIATAAYGTETAGQLNILREFRDQVLLKSALGTRFVETYYKLSPPVADFIAGSDFLRAVVRALFIDPMVTVLQWSQGLWGP
jgi:hypothetical protein